MKQAGIAQCNALPAFLVGHGEIAVPVYIDETDS
jgi:hypothetical protein